MAAFRAEDFRIHRDEPPKARPIEDVRREYEEEWTPLKPIEEICGRVDDMRRGCLASASIADEARMPEIHADLMELREHVERVETKLHGLVPR